MRITKNPNEKGSALAVVIILIAVIMIMITIAFQISASQTKLNPIYDNSVDSIHYADAGVNKYLWALNKGTPGSVPLTDTAYDDGYYNIDILESTDSYCRVQSTGWVAGKPGSDRKIEVLIGKRSFTQYSYLTDSDPDNLYWATGEKVFGPLHTNGNIRTNGTPAFYGRVTYSGVLNKDSGSVPQFIAGIEKVAKIIFPDTNTSLLTIAQADGYLYEGRTLILLNSNGTLSIVNKQRNIANGQSEDYRENRALPAGGVLYVNGTKDSTSKVMDGNRFDHTMGNVFVSGVLKGKLTIAAANDIYITGKDPTNSDFANATVTNGLTYADTGFNLDVATGITTVTGTLKDDMLGMIANNNIWILGKGWPTAGASIADVNVIPSIATIKIHAALFAINYYFGNEACNAWDNAYPRPAGNVEVRGSIIMKTAYATAMVSGSTVRGYMSDYAHDPRMLFSSPPKFINPANSGWEIIDWKETN